MTSFIIELTNNDFSLIEKDYNVIKIPNTNMAFVYCSFDDLSEIKKLSNFDRILSNNSIISEFINGL